MKTPAALSPLSKQRLRVWLRLLRAHQVIDTRVREGLRSDHGSTLPRFDVLAALDRHPDGLRMSELSAKLRVSNGNVTGIVERLASDGLIERVAIQGDRRATLVRLTPAGKDRFAGMAAEHERWIDEILSDYDEDELRTMNALLARIGEDD
ncbi:transcriptional regulator, MarR family [Tranquillimonas alkanivorans]|uniref:Transcriptional regulator, MarR family n=2 Tax=Tranquillimonas alkanivorans TaxID=441119 RepID=A0A1I5UG44_9RHOB|nr:transcriptional regulator, MarR family [Tranquillimonas alkanivorans]